MWYCPEIAPIEASLTGVRGEERSSSVSVDAWGWTPGGLEASGPVSSDVAWLKAIPELPYPDPGGWPGGEVWADLNGLHAGTHAGHITNHEYLCATGGDAVCTITLHVAPFADTPVSHWAWEHIAACLNAGVAAGYDDGLYRPEWQVTRDQMAVYVARSMVAPTGEAALADYVPVDPSNFPDVPDTFWAYNHIEYCAENGVVQGYDDGHYHPEYEVTRDQMAVYVARAFRLGM
jgi:hypothetical protein